MNYPPSKFARDATREDVLACFRLILGRYPNDTEWAAHTAHYVGKPLAAVVETYVNSAEFKNRGLLNQKMDDCEIVDLPSYRMYASASDVAVGSTIVKTRKYEPHVTRQVQSLLAPGSVFVDIGANIGWFSLLAASLVGSSGRVIAFEPSMDNVQLLYFSCMLNGFENVEIRPFALADQRKMFFLDRSGSNAAVAAISGGAPSSRSIVYASTLDLEIPTVSRVDVIKIDVEGAEYLALSGGEQLIRRTHPTIFAEFTPLALPHISGIQSTEFLRYMLSLGYEISLLEQGGRVRQYGKRYQDLINFCDDSRAEHVDLLFRPT